MMLNEQNFPIIVQDLSKKFGDFTAVDHINFEVKKGEIFGFLGPNGSGKTTTIRMMLGLMAPTTGNTLVLGLKVNGDTSRIRPRVGYMSQRFSLYNDLTVLQNLRFYSAAYGLNAEQQKQRIEEALTMSGLQEHKNTDTSDLSGGWRQRLALSAAVLHRPEVLFLDEPTAGVDPISRRDFWDLLYQLTTDGMTVFITTHYMDEAEHCHRLAFIQRGKIIAYGSASAIRKKVIKGQVIEIDTTDPAKTIKVLQNLLNEKKYPLDDIQLYGALVHAITMNAEKYASLLKNDLERSKLKINRISIIEPSLEDVFISAMNEKPEDK